MAIIAGIDSSSITASCAVFDTEKNIVLSTEFANNGLTHSQTLLPLINEAFTKAGISCADVDYFCVTNGPGSFTGLRIGLSTVKGMAAAHNKKCISISSLEAAGFGAYLSLCNGVKCNDGKPVLICAAMDARCKQVYNALFSCIDGQFNRICSDRALSLDELKKELAQIQKKYDKIILTGDGARLCFGNFSEITNCELCAEDRIYIHADSIALLGSKKLNDAVDCKEIMPFYLRLPQAQRELKLKREDSAKK